MAKLFGGFELEEFQGLDKLPQKAASAWTKVTELTGAKFKPILYAGKQVTKGINYGFIAEETLQTIGQERRLVALVVNEFNGEFEVLNDRFTVIFG